VAQAVGDVLVFLGALWMLVAAIGVARMPDLFQRMHASTKSTTLGLALLMLGASLHFGAVHITARALAVVVFYFITAPVAAHVLGRAAYLSGVTLWEGTLEDQLKGRYTPHTHQLRSTPSEEMGEEG